MARMIHASSGQPAEVFGLSGRGRITEGAFADIAVFDPATMRDEATFLDPTELATGMRFVLVNGVLSIDEGEPQRALDDYLQSRHREQRHQHCQHEPQHRRLRAVRAQYNDSRKPGWRGWTIGGRSAPHRIQRQGVAQPRRNRARIRPEQGRDFYTL